MNETNFLEDLLAEAEQKEIKETAAYYDLILLEISKLQSQIESKFAEAEKEIEIINEWALNKNSALQDKINFLALKLEAYIKEMGEKTISLPNGILKMHKKQDRIEIEDLELFLLKAKPEMLTIIPEQVKPDLNSIKAHIKTKSVPLGIKVIEGKDEFSYKLNNRKEYKNDATEEA